MDSISNTVSSPRKIAIFDIDGTLFRWQLYHELAFAIKNARYFSQDSSERIDKVYHAWKARQASFHDYEMSVVDAMNTHLADIPTDFFDKEARVVVEQSGHKIYAYTLRLIQNLKQQGYFLLAISGSPQEIAEIFAQKYGFDDCIGVVYGRNDDAFTGLVDRSIVGRKHIYVSEYIKQHGFSLDGSIGIGDSDGDISMLEIVKQPIAFNPSSELLAYALNHKWQVVIERKNIAYTLKDQNGSYILAQTDSL